VCLSAPPRRILKLIQQGAALDAASLRLGPFVVVVLWQLWNWSCLGVFLDITWRDVVIKRLNVEKPENKLLHERWTTYIIV